MTPPSPQSRRWNWIHLGWFAGMASAVLYTAANVQLRRAVAVDPFLVAAVKAIPIVVGLIPVVVWYRLAGRSLGSNYSMVPKFAAVALIGQFVGNAAFQVALQHIALAAAVPITLGTLIVGGGGLGWVILGEPINRGKWLAMGMLIAAVVVLSTGDTRTNALVSPILPEQQVEFEQPIESKVTEVSGGAAELATPDPAHVSVPWIGGLCAFASGAAYSLFGVVMRQTLQSGLSLPATMLISGSIGAVALWGFCFFWLGPDAIIEISMAQWTTMVWAGIFNFAAFVALSAALKSLPVVAVNLINASQVAMAALAGIYFFGEIMTGSIYVGISLTVIGLVVLTASGFQSRRMNR